MQRGEQVFPFSSREGERRVRRFLLGLFKPTYLEAKSHPDMKTLVLTITYLNMPFLSSYHNFQFQVGQFFIF
jgi:hypothetical protein